MNNIPLNTTATIDKNHLEVVLRNLVSNAIKFSHENTSVVLSTEETEEGIVIQVADTGVGIPDTKIQGLFAKKGTVVSTIGTSGEKGTGLGLIICKELIEKNKGTISAQPNYPTGTVFKLSLMK